MNDHYRHILDLLRASIQPSSNKLSPVFPYAGGKHKYAKWIRSHFPPQNRFKTYVEPFGGAASVMLSGPPVADVEIYNDINQSIVTFFRVLQDREKCNRLIDRILVTPYARDSHDEARDIFRRISDYDDVTIAWAVFVLYSMVRSGKVGGAFSRRVSLNSAKAFRSRVYNLISYYVNRVSTIVIDRDDALRCIERYDSPKTLFYVDPPYAIGKEKVKRYYGVGYGYDDHERLIDTLLSVEGMVILSGYDHPVYDRFRSAGWSMVTKDTYVHMSNTSDSRDRRTEVLWMNYTIDNGGLGRGLF